VKRLDLAPYHVFEQRGMKFAFDLEKLIFIRLDDVSYALLKRLLAGQTLGTAAAELEKEHPPTRVEQAMSEYLALRRNGLLVGPVLSYDDDDYERQVDRLLHMSTGRIELYLAEACNMRCKYCYVNENEALNNGLMPWDVAKAAVDLVFRRSADIPDMQITFFGGEPLLNKPVMRKVIAYSQELGEQHGKTVRYSLTTNGTLLDDEVIAYIKRHNFGLMISVDGPPEVHNDMRPMADGRDSFDTIARNVKALMRRRRLVTVRCTLSNRHLNMYDIVTFLEDFGFTRIAPSTCQGKAHRLGEYDVGPEHKEALEAEQDRLLDRWLGQVKRGETLRYDPYSGAVRGMIGGRKRPPMLRCGICRGCTTVGIDGKLYPCHRYVGMGTHVIGDVWSGVDDQKHAREVRGYFETRRKCESCWAVNMCGGMCPWYVSHEDGGYVDPPDWRCDSVKHWIERSAWIYETVRQECPEYVERIAQEYDEREHQSQGKPTETRSRVTAE
jgi:uncharacterized protein